MEYKTDRLTLKSFASKDAEDALNILTDESVKRTYMLPDYENRADALPLFLRLLQLSADDTRYVRGIYRNGRLIGFLNDVEIKNGSIELGYVIHPSHQGQGYMTEALGAAIQDLFRIGYQEIICGAFEENTASIRVMEKCGMIRRNKIDTIEYCGATHRCVYYSVKEQE